MRLLPRPEEGETAVPINYTTIGAINARLKRSGLPEAEVTVVAFGWTDAEPEAYTGVWVLGSALKTDGLTFISADEIDSLEPQTPAAETALARANAEIARALRDAEEAKLERDAAIRRADAAGAVALVEEEVIREVEVERDVARQEARIAEDVAVAATEHSIEVDAKLDTLEQEAAQPAEESESDAPKSERKRSTTARSKKTTAAPRRAANR
jgi:hypothetical protein